MIRMKYIKEKGKNNSNKMKTILVDLMKKDL